MASGRGAQCIAAEHDGEIISKRLPALLQQIWRLRSSGASEILSPVRWLHKLGTSIT